MTTFKDDPESGSGVADGGKPVDRETADFTTHARHLLRDSIEHLDGRTRSRLTQARYAALAQLEAETRRSVERRWLLPAGALAAVAAVAMAWLGSRGVDAPPQAVVSVASPLDDMEIMAGTENLELLEDLEFYAWLDAEAEATLPPSGGQAG